MSLGLRKDAVWLHEYRLSSMKIAAIISKSSSKKFRFKEGNKFGHKFKKGFKYDKEFGRNIEEVKLLCLDIEREYGVYDKIKSIINYGRYYN